MNSTGNKFEYILNKIKNNQLLAILILVCIFITSIGSLTDSFDKVYNFFYKHIRKQDESTKAIKLRSDKNLIIINLNEGTVLVEKVFTINSQNNKLLRKKNIKNNKIVNNLIIIDVIKGTICGIKMGSTPQALYNHFGKENVKKHMQKQPGPYKFTFHINDKMGIVFRYNHDEILQQVDISRARKYTTGEGIAIGDSMEKILSVYGEPVNKDYPSNNLVIINNYYFNFMKLGFVELKSKPGIIHAISARYASNY